MASSSDSPIVEVTIENDNNNISSSAVKPEVVVYRQWLQQLSSSIDELKGKIREKQEAITAEKRKSLSRRTTGGGKNNRNNNNRNQANPNETAAAAAASQRTIEVLEKLLNVFREELTAMEAFVKVVAVFVIKNSSDAEEESLVTLLQPFQPMLKGLAPKNTLQVKTPIRRNSSKRSSGRRNRNRRSNSQSRVSPDKLKMKEIIGAIKTDQENENEQEVDVLAEREKLLTLQYYGSHFADTLKLDAEASETETTISQDEVAIEETATSAEPKVEEIIQIPAPDKGDLVEPASSAEAVQLKENGDNSEPAETVIESQQAELSEAAVPKTYAKAAAAEKSTSVSIPKFAKLVDPLPSEAIVSVADQSETVEAASQPPAQIAANGTEATAKQPLENDKSTDAEVAKDEATAENTATKSVELETETKDETVVQADTPEPKEEVKIETPESPEILENVSKNISATAATEPPPATITKSESTILNENPSLALPVICSPNLPRAEFAPVSATVDDVELTEKVIKSTTKPSDVDAPPSPLPSSAIPEPSNTEVDKKGETKVNNTEIFDRIVESAEKAKEKTTLLKPSEGDEKNSPAATDNKYGTFSEPKAEVAGQQTEESKVENEVPEPAAVKTADDSETPKPETPKPSADAPAKRPASAAKNGASKNNNNSSSKDGLKKRSSAKKEKKTKSGKRSSANNNGSNAGRSKPKCCSIM